MPYSNAHIHKCTHTYICVHAYEHTHTAESLTDTTAVVTKCLSFALPRPGGMFLWPRLAFALEFHRQQALFSQLSLLNFLLSFEIC